MITNTYYLELVFTKYFLAIEIDEKSHTDRDITFEEKRQELEDKNKIKELEDKSKIKELEDEIKKLSFQLTSQGTQNNDDNDDNDNK